MTEKLQKCCVFGCSKAASIISEGKLYCAKHAIEREPPPHRRGRAANSN